MRRHWDIKFTRRQREVPWGVKEPAPGWKPVGIDAFLNAEEKLLIKFYDGTLSADVSLTPRGYVKVWCYHVVGRDHTHLREFSMFMVAESLWLSQRAEREVHYGNLFVPDELSAHEAATAMTYAVARYRVRPDPVGFKFLVKPFAVFGPNNKIMMPSRLMPEANCDDYKLHTAPDLECLCGYHATYSPWCFYPNYGVLVVQAVGPTIWHANAWRARQYFVHAAVVSLDCKVPPKWDASIPIVRAETPDRPLRAWEIAEEVKIGNVLKEEVTA